MKSTQMEYIEVNDPEGPTDTKLIPRTSVCFKLREQEVDGEKFLAATDAIYKRDAKSGALLLQYNGKLGKAAKKAAKRERIKERNRLKEVIA